MERMKVKRNRAGNKYTFTAEDEEDEKFLDKVNKKINELEEENKKLKEEIKERQEEVERFKSNAMADADYELKLEKENKKLKEIMRDVLYRTTKHNIKNVVYKGEKIEIGNGDYDYTLD